MNEQPAPQCPRRSPDDRGSAKKRHHRQDKQDALMVEFRALWTGQRRWYCGQLDQRSVRVMKIANDSRDRAAGRTRDGRGQIPHTAGRAVANRMKTPKIIQSSNTIRARLALPCSAHGRPRQRRPLYPTLRRREDAPSAQSLEQSAEGGAGARHRPPRSNALGLRLCWPTAAS